MKGFTMKHDGMKDFTERRAAPHIAVDADGRLYDRHVRAQLEQLVGPDAARRLEAFAAIRWLMRRSQHFMESWVEQYGLSEGRMQILLRLHHHGDQPLGALADEMHVSPRNVTGLVDNLERDGLVARVPDPEDRRSVRAHLSEQGARLIQRIWKEFMQRSLVVVEGLPPEDLERVRHTCLQLISRIDAQLDQEETTTLTTRSKK
jgi:DNA-binding MarR family transcriptional regulator